MMSKYQEVTAEGKYVKSPKKRNPYTHCKFCRGLFLPPPSSSLEARSHLHTLLLTYARLVCSDFTMLRTRAGIVRMAGTLLRWNSYTLSYSRRSVL